MKPKENEFLYDRAAKKWFKAKRGLFGRKKYIDRVPPGKYEVLWSSNHSGLKPKTRHEDVFYEFTGPTKNAYDEFLKFWQVKPKYEELGLSFKRGFFLWGPPGTGKTTVISRMADYVVNELGGVVLYSAEHLNDEISIFKEVCTDGSFPILIVMEDFEASVQSMGWEKSILAFLDGEDQINNIVFLGTSNYPELANKRIFDRPSRFDTVLYVGPPEYKFKYDYVLAKVKDPSLAEKIASNSEGFTIAHLKEVIVCVYCLGQDVDEVLEKINKMKEASPNSAESPDRQRLGFSLGD